jgi:uncharacterized protein (DUF362 family)
VQREGLSSILVEMAPARSDNAVARVAFKDYETSVPAALDLVAAAARLPRSGLIVIKPNLTNADPPPVTTHVGAAEAVCRYCREHTQCEIAIGEGCGRGRTGDVFEATGYAALAKRHKLKLIDFNTEKAILLSRTDTLQLRQFHMPEVLKDAFLISLPVLKDHSFTVTTIAMKNMFGIAPAPFYRGSWNKSKLHHPSTHHSVVDICLYKRPDLSVVDASVALAGMHLAGASMKLGIILAGFDPVAVDTVGSSLMGHDPRAIEYLTLAHGRLGDMENFRVVEG